MASDHITEAEYDTIYLKFQRVSEADGTMGLDELSSVLQELGMPVSVEDSLIRFLGPSSAASGIMSADRRIHATRFLQWIYGRAHNLTLEGRMAAPEVQGMPNQTLAAADEVHVTAPELENTSILATVEGSSIGLVQKFPMYVVHVRDVLENDGKSLRQASPATN